MAAGACVAHAAPHLACAPRAATRLRARRPTSRCGIGRGGTTGHPSSCPPLLPLCVATRLRVFFHCSFGPLHSVELIRLPRLEAATRRPAAVPPGTTARPQRQDPRDIAATAPVGSRRSSCVFLGPIGSSRTDKRQCKGLTVARRLATRGGAGGSRVGTSGTSRRQGMLLSETFAAALGGKSDTSQTFERTLLHSLTTVRATYAGAPANTDGEERSG